MVRSVISKEVNYDETRGLNEKDKLYQSTIYVVTLKGVTVEVALGQAEYKLDDGLVYYPVYLVKNGEFDSQIGVYETVSSRLPSLIDADGEVDLAKLGEPLLYSFVDRPMLEAAKAAGGDGDSGDGDSGDGDSGDGDSGDGDGNSSDGDIADEHTPEQNKKTDEDERADYDPQEEDTWVEVYMENNNYTVLDNEGGGDCLFAAIRDGLASVGEDVSVAEMREKLAEAATQELYEGYKEQFDMYSSMLTAARANVAKLGKTSAALKRELRKRGRDSGVVQEVRDKAAALAEELAAERGERDMAVAMLAEFKWMHGISSLESFRTKIQTCAFWGDTWAISTLERLLKTKLIILSEERFDEGDMSGVLQCTELGDKVLEEAGVFNPEWYVMLSYNGSHYKLILYRSLGAMHFAQIPFAIKQKIVDKCLERLAGPFALIPGFVELRTAEAGEADDSAGEELAGDDDAVVAIQDEADEGGESGLHQMREIVPEDELSDEAALSLLKRADGNVLRALNMFYEGVAERPAVPHSDEASVPEAALPEAHLAALPEAHLAALPEAGDPLASDTQDELTIGARMPGRPLPGKGEGESVVDPSKYAILSSIKDWRRKLHDTHMHPVTITGVDGKKTEYPSGQHYLYSRLVAHNPSFANEFVSGSGSAIAKSVDAAEAAVGKTGLYKGKRLRAVDIDVRDAPNEERDVDRVRMLKSKFVDRTMRAALNATGEAKLFERMSRKPKRLDRWLMKER